MTMAEKIKYWPRRGATVVFLVVTGILTTAADFPTNLPSTDTMKGIESMVLTLGLGVVLALFLAWAFAWLMRWVLSTSAERESKLMAELAEQRKAFQAALEKLKFAHCPLHAGGVEEVFERERAQFHQGKPRGDRET